LPGPWVIKPVAFSARFHTYLAKTFPELVTALKIISMDVDDVLVEEYISGREFVSGVVPEFRDQERYVVPPHELQHGKELFSHQTGRVGEFNIVPASQISPKIKNLLEKLSHEIHEDFNIGDTGVFHFIMSPKGVYVISLQDGPELHEHAPLYRSLEHVGSNADEFIHSRIARLLKKKK
jgi:D-alanine-D-alanine ligase-like ATP-grasp enzyme